MKNRLIVFGGLFLMACSGGEGEEQSNGTQEVVDNEEKDVVIYHSDLRPEIEEWDMTQVFIDTVDFVDFNGDADYASVTVKTNNGKNVSLVTEDFIDNDFMSGNQMIIEWVLDSLYEAGEGDELYFGERMISFRVFGEKYEFTEFLRNFAYDYAANKDLTSYIHPEAGNYEAFNPGAYCVLGKASKDSNGDFVDTESDYILTDAEPVGDFCEGYTSGPGFYFSFIEENDFPGYADMSGDQDVMKSITPELPENYETVVEVLVVNNGYFNRYWYFYKLDGKWYLWIEDYCDCSA